MFKDTVNLLENNLCYFNGQVPNDNDTFYFYSNHTGTASDLYLSLDKSLLLKVQKYKYDFKSNFFKCMLRDLFKKFTYLNLDARRECKGYKIVSLAGLKTPTFFCWGTSYSPLNDILSFMVIEYKQDVVSGFTYFNSLPINKRGKFIKKLAYEASVVVRLGYMHRDFHLNNFLVNKVGDIFWIDNHFKKLSYNKKKKMKQIESSLIAHKLGGEKYMKIAHDILTIAN